MRKIIGLAHIITRAVALALQQGYRPSFTTLAARADAFTARMAELSAAQYARVAERSARFEEQRKSEDASEMSVADPADPLVSQERPRGGFVRGH